MTKQKRTHYVLVKSQTVTEAGGIECGWLSSRKLLSAGMWPLYERTLCRKMVREDERVLIYVAGDEIHGRHIVAEARIAAVEPWTKRAAAECPILLDGVPATVLRLDEIHYLDKPVRVADVLDRLTIAPKNPSKWGFLFAAGMRSLEKADFDVLRGVA